MIQTRRSGFSLVEVIIAMLILSMGVLAMGASTGFVMRQIQASELRSDRMAAVRQAAEILGGTQWGSLQAACEPEPAFTHGRYDIGCEVELDGNLARIRLISTGPGFQGIDFQRAIADTFTISLAQP